MAQNTTSSISGTPSLVKPPTTQGSWYALLTVAVTVAPSYQ